MLGVYEHSSSMDRNSSSERGQRGEAGRRSRVLQLALKYPFHHALRYAATELIVMMIIPLNTEQQMIFWQAAYRADIYQ